MVQNFFKPRSGEKNICATWREKFSGLPWVSGGMLPQKILKIKYLNVAVKLMHFQE